MQRFLLTLSFLSGTCGLAYELLYARMLSTYLGDMFYVAAAILAAFLLSLAVGSFVAHRGARFLPWIEIAIGAYALMFAYLFNHQATTFMPWLVGGTVPTPFLLVMAVFIVLIIPAMLIGFSVPLFTLYQKQRQPKHKDKSAPFRSVYTCYNLGAAFCVLALEYIVLRLWGISATVYGIAFINFAIGIALFFVPAPTKALLSKKIPIAQMPQKHHWQALFLASVASGIFQLLLLKTSNFVFGPYHENFAIVLAIGLCGLALGSLLAPRLASAKIPLFLLTAVATGLILCLTTPWIYSWAYLNQYITGLLLPSWILKILVLFIYGLAPLTLFGAAIPYLLKLYPGHAATPGRALALAAAGNFVGYFISIFLLHEYVPEPFTGALILLFLLLAAFIFQQKKLHYPVAATVAGLGILLFFIWPNHLLFLSYRDLSTLDSLTRTVEQTQHIETHKKLDTTVSLVKTTTGSTRYIINGYLSLTLDTSNKANLRETIVGAAPAFYTREHKKALMLGLGTGITPSAATEIYEETTVVEISPLVAQMLPLFADENMGLANNPDLQLKLQDGLIALMQTNERYDAIINSVTSPLYFSSSKLYTRDFFDLAASRLKPGGVYTLWFDGHVALEGMRIIMETLKQSFADCHFVFLSQGYNEVICSKEKLKPRMLPETFWPDRLRQKFTEHAFGMGISEFLSYLLFPHNMTFDDKSLHGTHWADGANTFDHPRLEFSIAQKILSEHSLRKGKARKRPMSNLPEYLLRKDIFTGHLMGENAYYRRCFALHAMEKTTKCLPVNEKGKTIYPPAYLELATPYFLNSMAKSGTKNDYQLMNMAEELVLQNKIEDALKIINRILCQPREHWWHDPGRFVMSRFYAHMRSDGNTSDEEINMLARLSPPPEGELKGWFDWLKNARKQGTKPLPHKEVVCP